MLTDEARPYECGGFCGEVEDECRLSQFRSTVLLNDGRYRQADWWFDAPSVEQCYS